MKHQILSLACIVVVVLFLLADFELTWLSRTGIRDLYHFNKRDFYFVSLFILPAITSHLITIWSHYYRADSIFQENIVNVSTATAKERKRISVWERHDPWLGYTYKYWTLVSVSVFLNLIWFVQPLIAYVPKFSKFLGMYGAMTAYMAFGSGYAAMGSCGMLMLLVLRRSMLQALGFTYADILPLHRWLGVAFIAWSTIHAACYILYYIHFDVFWNQFNFDGTTRGPQNMIALGAYGALLGLGITAIPQVRRSCYLLFITAHRVFTVITFVGTLMHFPYYMIWYYVLPAICLYFADRFVPKFIQSCSIAPDMFCSFNKDADVMTVVLVSKNRLEPLKPYYPGDYVSLEIPEISTIYHPFTIASYWAEDPYSMTIYVRTFQENKTSWTGALATLCGESEEPVMVRTNVDGVFGDRVHDYLSSKVMVIFAAGAAITTFMSLLKAMAAQIEVAGKTMDNPATIEVHLICTFRYESELYAYGDFMQRITHDPRFTSWLRTEIYVSRPDKYALPVACPSGECTSEFVCGRIEEDRSDENESTSLLASHSGSKYGAVYSGNGNNNNSNKGGCCTGSSTACPSSSCSSLTITDTVSPDKADEIKAEPILFQYKSLPTFSDASSAASATVHAKRDLIATTIILVVPMIAFLCSRAIPWEGTYQGQYRWCRTSKDHNQHVTNRCLWSYALLPGIVHVAVASAIGYLGLWVARRSNFLQSASKTFPTSAVRHATATATDIESHAAAATVVASYRNLVLGLSAPDSAPNNNNSSNVNNGISSCNSMAEMKRSKGRIQFKRGRIQVNHHIQELMAMGIGQECNRGEDLERMEAKHGGVIVFGGGPDAFVDMIEQSCKKSRWDVDFHRETWAP